MLKHRLFNRSISSSQRILQITNALVESVASKPLNLAHIVEFPKCGGSWVRNMIRTYRGNELFEYNRIIGRNEVIMGHRLYHRRFYRPIVVVRDPRDMYVSFYHYENTYENRDKSSALFRYFRHDPKRSIQEDFYEYLKVKLLKHSHPWFYYSQFLDSWLNRPGVCLVKYEDCLKDPESQLIRMLRFLGDNIELDKIANTVQETSFKAITAAKYGHSRKPGEVDNSKFHRKGMAGDWKGHFNEKSSRLLDKFEGDSLKRLNYENDSDWIADLANKLCNTNN